MPTPFLICRFLRLSSVEESCALLMLGKNHNTIKATKPTGTQREQFKIAREELDGESTKIRQMTERDLKDLERLLDKLGAPWTPGRLPGGKDEK